MAKTGFVATGRTASSSRQSGGGAKGEGDVEGKAVQDRCVNRHGGVQAGGLIGPSRPGSACPALE